MDINKQVVTTICVHSRRWYRRLLGSWCESQISAARTDAVEKQAQLVRDHITNLYDRMHGLQEEMNGQQMEIQQLQGLVQQLQLMPRVEEDLP